MTDDNPVTESRRIVVLVPASMADALEARASAADRPVSAECRRAFRLYLETTTGEQAA